MNKEFKYSILQYKHSELLGEAINIALLLYFPFNRKIELVIGNLQRIKSIYPEFNIAFLEKILQKIDLKVTPLQDVLRFQSDSIIDLDQFLHHNILAEDATVLQFTRSKTVSLKAEFTQQLKDTYVDLFLPGKNKIEAVEVGNGEHFSPIE